MIKVAVLGSTGSIGTQTMDVLRRYPNKFKTVSLVAYSNGEKLAEQSHEFNPEYTALISLDGEQCLIEAVKNCNLAVVATRGICALEAVLYCLDHDIDIALANKETMVCAGKLICDKLKKSKSHLIPVDSEHFAISQCLLGRSIRDVKRLLLTASGGPFWNFDKDSFASITPKQALKHPNWNMGSKITVDSATMMNKAFEVIEAKWLFDVPADKIDIVVHRQSIVHSMAEFCDGSIMAQMANPDMRIPIQSALLGETGKQVTPSVDFGKLLTLTFEYCDFDKFPCARLGYKIFEYPPLAATIMNAANDVCVDKFLQDKLLFTDFFNIIISTVKYFADKAANDELTVTNIKIYDERSRKYASDLIDGVIC